MILRHALALSAAEHIECADQEQAIHSFGDRRVNNTTHQDGMEVEIRIRHADEMDNGGRTPQKVNARLAAALSPSPGEPLAEKLLHSRCELSTHIDIADVFEDFGLRRIGLNH